MEIEASRTALLPQSEPVSQVTVRYQPRLDDLKATAVAAKNSAELAKAAKDFSDWKRVVLCELYDEAQKAFRGADTLATFSTRKAQETEFVQSIRQQFVNRRVAAAVASVRAASFSGTSPDASSAQMFDNAASFRASPPAPPAQVVDGAVKAEPLQGEAKYRKLRDIAIRSWGANPKIVDAAIAEAVRQKVDPALVLAVIWQESRFNAHATSPVGARGLMQVMPDTGRGLGVSNPDMLYDMKTNLRAGVQYLRNAVKYLKLDFDLSDISDAAPNKIKALLASYNAGCGAVSKWLRQQGSDLVRIPYAETRHYVRVIGDKLASLGASLGW